MKRLPFLILLWVLLFSGTKANSQIAIYGDTRSHPEVHQKLIELMQQHNPLLAIHTGDLNSAGTSQAEYDRFFSIVAPLTDICPLWAVKGNHEKNRELFLQQFPVLGEKGYASLEHSGLAIYLLDSTIDINPGSEQYRWLENALQDSLPGIVILHHPVFSSGEHGDELSLHLFLPQLLAKGNILAVFSGHDHDYERSTYNGISYIVTGGGGSPQREKRTPNPYSQVFAIEYHYIMLNPTEGGFQAEVWNLESRLLDSFFLPTTSQELH